MISRKTRQKLTIESAIKSQKGIFTVDDIYENLKNKNIGIATVYRYMNNLRKSGKIHYYTCNNRFVYSIKKTVHAHFICEKCHQKEHIKIHDINWLKKYGDVCHVQIEIYGICKHCKLKP